ncbi:induced myeloid leukemia cell differentiation protein Mcl-1 homolog [Neoarius graeffei]|uniref:induced myeloid leukemia cell differentiation protein Mcl-1 homolog n=1 Tax=Neoarius graeffei TaxID=443677 RepID=UPI00298C5E4E|nr:induced myeloid leukemia cell differentiation protein Mcl-1 homolog [Neoarius graeffei]
MTELSVMKRSAPLSLLCCGLENGGAVRWVSPLSAPLDTFSQKREEELDVCTEEADGRAAGAGINAGKAPVESRSELEERGCEELLNPELETETYELLRQLFRSHTGLPVEHRRNKAHSALPSLQRVVGKTIHNHRIAYTGMVRRLFENSSLDGVGSVLSGVFDDGVISWGRIASVLALGAVVCERLKQDCAKEQVEECVDIVALQISSYLTTNLQHWFINNNGWDGFVEFFYVEDPESTVRKALMAVAGFGIGACLLTLMR